MISGSAWGNDLYGRLVGMGFLGSALPKFTTAVGDGCALEVIGKSFTTVDVGTVPGAGIGTGTGITGLNAATMSNEIFAMCVSLFGQEGTKLKDTCDAIAATCVAQLGNATLMSVDAPVVLGVGTITVGSITVDPSSWSSLITTQGDAAGFLGAQWPTWAMAIGSGQSQEVLAAGTGTLVIAGPTPGSPAPGGGAGTGTIS
jgi:hypothetical protein